MKTPWLLTLEAGVLIGAKHIPSWTRLHPPKRQPGLEAYSAARLGYDHKMPFVSDFEFISRKENWMNAQCAIVIIIENFRACLC